MTLILEDVFMLGFETHLVPGVDMTTNAILYTEPNIGGIKILFNMSNFVWDYVTSQYL